MDLSPVPKPSDEELSRLNAQHGPARPQAYTALRPWHDLTQALRAKGALAETVRHILRARNVEGSETTVRNCFREVPGEASAPVLAPGRMARRGPRPSPCPQSHPRRFPKPFNIPVLAVQASPTSNAIQTPVVVVWL